MNLVSILLTASIAIVGAVDTGGAKMTSVYFVRHAEKKTTMTASGSATAMYDLDWVSDEAIIVPRTMNGTSVGDNLNEVCGTSKCAEELSDLGLLKADLIGGWMAEVGIAAKLDAIYSSHKRRTAQTIEPAAKFAGMNITQFPEGATELDPEGTSASICPTVAAILNSPPGSTLLVSGHTGTLYKIMDGGNDDDCTGLGLDTSDQLIFPKDPKGKIPSDQFGDIWSVEIDEDGVVYFKDHINLSPVLTISGSTNDETTKDANSASVTEASFGFETLCITATLLLALLVGEM